MHYKIASLVLNASKHLNGCREVHITQPDAVKENLAGKIFVLAEIDGKKNEVKKVIDFITESLEEFYYNDDKIFLLDKIEGLSLENIFEAALAKLNKALLEFLAEEKIHLQAEDANLVIGLLFENNLHFSNFGRNKAFLIYKRQDDYDIINVETSAADADDGGALIASGPKFFSSVITGKIPAASYFLFCNEVLPEYLSNKDLITIITKLPPMVAAEQIKSALSKVNTYVPFLGIIVKNTYGLSASDLKDDLGAEITQSAHNSISHLNYTERKTEQMLAPAGLVNWNKFGKFFSWDKNKVFSKGALKMKSSSDSAVSLPPLSRQVTVSASRLIKEKIAFGRSHSKIVGAFKTIGVTIINIFNPIFWKQSYSRGRAWLRSLHPRSRSMFILLGVVALILTGSITLTVVRNNKKANAEEFFRLAYDLEEKKGMIESYLLYGNQEGAKTVIGQSLAAIDSLVVKGEEQTAERDRLRAELEILRAKVQKLTSVINPEHIGDFNYINASAETQNLIINGDKALAADPAGKAVYTIDLQNKNVSSFLLNGDIKTLDKPVVWENFIYYLNTNQLIKLNPENGDNSSLSIANIGADDKIDSFQFYNNTRDYLYLLMADAGKLYRLNPGGGGYTGRIDWMNDDTALSDAVSMGINNDIFVLRSNGQIIRLKAGRRVDFSLEPVDPRLENASLLREINSKLYILDRNSKRLLIFGFDGKLIWQYQLSSLNNIKDFSLSADEKSAYFLNDNSLYRISLER